MKSFISTHAISMLIIRGYVDVNLCLDFFFFNLILTNQRCNRILVCKWVIYIYQMHTLSRKRPTNWWNSSVTNHTTGHFWFAFLSHICMLLPLAVRYKPCASHIHPWSSICHPVLSLVNSNHMHLIRWDLSSKLSATSDIISSLMNLDGLLY